MSLTSGVQSRQDPLVQCRRRIDGLKEVIRAQQQENDRLAARIAELERNDQAQMSEILRLRRLEQFRMMGEGNV